MEKCPKCGQPNGCAIANHQDPKRCWCMSVTVPEHVKHDIAKTSHKAACLCMTCLKKEIDQYLTRKL